MKSLATCPYVAGVACKTNSHPWLKNNNSTGSSGACSDINKSLSRVSASALASVMLLPNIILFTSSTSLEHCPRSIPENSVEMAEVKYSVTSIGVSFPLSSLLTISSPARDGLLIVHPTCLPNKQQSSQRLMPGTPFISVRDRNPPAWSPWCILTC